MLPVVFFSFLFRQSSSSGLQELLLAANHIFSFWGKLNHTMKPHIGETTTIKFWMICYLANKFVWPVIAEVSESSSRATCVRCPPKQPGRRATPFSPLNQSILGRRTVHKTIGWLNYSTIVRKGSAAPFTSYHPQPNLVHDCFNSNLIWIYVSTTLSTALP